MRTNRVKKMKKSSFTRKMFPSNIVILFEKSLGVQFHFKTDIIHQTENLKWYEFQKAIFFNAWKSK